MAELDSAAQLRHESWKRFVHAVIAYQKGWKDGVVSYLRSVEQTAGREVALSTREQVKACARAESWSTAEKWPAWGYQAKPPTPTLGKRRKK